MDTSALANAEFWLSWITFGKLVATALVAIGVAMEFGGDWLAAANERAAVAERETALASERIAQLESDTAQLKHRRINDEQHTLLVELLRADNVPKGKVVFNPLVTGDYAPLDLLARQRYILLHRGWSHGNGQAAVHPPDDNPGMGGAFPDR
jgi:hypothetical protein